MNKVYKTLSLVSLTILFGISHLASEVNPEVIISTFNWLPFIFPNRDWGVVTVDNAGDTGYTPSIALDISGKPHIAYMDRTNGDLRYSYWNGVNWVTETVDSPGIVGGTPSIAIDASRKPHISYFDYTNEDLIYAYKNSSGTWVRQIVDSNGSVGLYSSLKIDSNGTVHIAYYDISNGNLKYTKRTSSGGWTIQTIDSAGDVGQFASLALQNGLPSIAYLDWTNGRLRFASKNPSGSWNRETVDSDGLVGYYCSLALNSSGAARIAYFDAINQNLKYAKKSASGWTKETVDSSGDVGTFTSLALDDNNKPHISYYDNTRNKIKYARKTDSDWELESLAATDPNNNPVSISSYSYSSIMVTSSDNVHIVYQDSVNDDLKYARLSRRPDLYWTAEAGYTHDGLEPHQGDSFTAFKFRVKYKDLDGDAPLSGYPKLHVKKAGQEINGSPFSLSPESGSAATGAIYTTSITLPDGNDTTYYFEAYDVWGVQAWSTANKNGPTVTLAGSQGIAEAYNFPNPVKSDHTTFRFVAHYTEPHLELKIYDLSGELIKTVSQEALTALSSSQYEYRWDLKSASGQDLASGVYFWILKARDKTSNKDTKVIKKLAILK